MADVKKRILIIDDDQFFIKLMDMAFKKYGYEVLQAMQGKQAIEILKEQSVDMIIVDLMMPELDGLGFLHWLRQEAKLNTPTLVQTGLAKDNINAEAQAAGANAVMYKPVKVVDLIEKVKELVQGI